MVQPVNAEATNVNDGALNHSEPLPNNNNNNNDSIITNDSNTIENTNNNSKENNKNNSKKRQRSDDADATPSKALCLEGLPAAWSDADVRRFLAEHAIVPLEHLKKIPQRPVAYLGFKVNQNHIVFDLYWWVMTGLHIFQ